MHNDDHDLGLHYDLPKLIESATNRRRVLSWLAASGTTVLLAACGSGSSGSDADVVGSNSGSSGAGSDTSAPDECALPASETAGPYPADGSNTRNGSVVNVLEDSGVVRSDITKSFGAASGVAAGVPMTLTMKLLDVNNLCTPLEGYAVYLWHCTNDGEYTLYSNSLGNENYLRGVQVADANGDVSFTTIFPGCYSGRYPHMHFEVYPSLDIATLYTNRVLTSQIAFSEAVCDAVYATDGYSNSASNFARTSIAGDNVFGDNTAVQLAVMTPALSGDVISGFDGSMTIGVPGI